MTKIAVIDDNEDLLFTIKYGLEKAGADYEIVTFEDPNVFVDDSKKNKYDLILLDIMMPQKDGWDTFVEINSDDSKNSETPIVFLTAKTDDQSKRLGSSAATDYVTKPFKIPDLLEKINKLLKK